MWWTFTEHASTWAGAPGVILRGEGTSGTQGTCPRRADRSALLFSHLLGKPTEGVKGRLESGSNPAHNTDPPVPPQDVQGPSHPRPGEGSSMGNDQPRTRSHFLPSSPTTPTSAYSVLAVLPQVLCQHLQRVYEFTFIPPTMGIPLRQLLSILFNAIALVKSTYSTTSWQVNGNFLSLKTILEAQCKYRVLVQVQQKDKSPDSLLLVSLFFKLQEQASIVSHPWCHSTCTSKECHQQRVQP